MVDLNLNSLQVNDDGRVSFSGLGSGIDFEAAVEGIIAAKRLPVDRLETKIETNTEKLTALQTERSLTVGLQESLQDLHGAVSFDQSTDLFAAKQAFASASRSDGGAASSPANLIGVAVTSTAAAGTHTIELLQTARAHRIGSASFNALDSDIGTARGQAAESISGDIEIAGVTIAVLATDTLPDLVDRINNANSGETATGVSASVVSTSDTEHFLVLTADETGQTIGTDISLNDPNSVLEDLGVLTSGGGSFASELQSAQKAQFHADGLLDGANYSSVAQADSVTALGQDGTLTFNDTSGALIGTIAYTATDTMDDIAAAITGDGTLSGAGITASVSADGSGSTLQLSGSSSFNLEDSGGLVSTLGIGKDDLVIERSSNTVSDLFEGVTLTLLQAEVGTTISVDVERDLSNVKTGIANFIDNYNALRQELNIQLNVDPTSGEASEDSVLFGNSALEEMDRRLESIVGGGADGVSSAFSVLAQIGIDFIANGDLSDTILRDTLELNEEQLDDALLNNLEDVQKLFQFDFAASDPRVVLLGFDGETTHTSAGYTMDIDYDEGGGVINSLTLDDGTASAEGNTITIDSGGAKGLRLFYSGDTDLSGVSLDFTVGVGAKLFFDLGEILDDDAGVIASEVDNLTGQNELAEERTTAMLDRLERERESVLNKFIRMEAALASMNQTLAQVTQITEAMFQDR
jgi:flagellar hook-associated protein 2